MSDELKTENEHLRAAMNRDFGCATFLMLYDAWRAAASNEECAHILRLYCTNGDKFIEKYDKR